MWLLRLPLPRDRRVPLPVGRHLFPWHFDEGETSRLAELLAGLLAGVERRLVLPWSAARMLASAANAVVMRDTLLLITVTFDDAALSDAEIDDVLGRITGVHTMLRLPRPQESGYAWQERHIKPAVMTLLHEQIADEDHPLASLNVAALPVRLAASLTADALGLVDLLEATMDHRLLHAADGTSTLDYETSLYHAAGQRIANRLLRLPSERLDDAISVLDKRGTGTWSDQRFRVGALALQDVGLARVTGTSVSLDPLARRATAPQILAAWGGLRSRVFESSTAPRWIVATGADQGARPMAREDDERVASGGAAPSALTSLRSARQATETAPLEVFDRVKRWVQDGADFKERCRRAQDFLDDPDRSKLVSTDRASEYHLWHDVIRLQFTEDEWRQINFIHVADLDYDETVAATVKRRAKSRSDARATFRGFHTLDRKRFSAQVAFFRQIDAFLERRRDLRVDLARWMTFAFDRDLVDERKAYFVDLLSWMWRSIVEAPANRHDVRDEAHGVIRRCLALALKNHYEPERKHIEEDAQAIGLDVSGVGPAGERPPDFLQKMKEGFEKMLDGAFREARLAYEQAGALAKQRGDAFDAWVALHGEEDAVWASRSFQDLAKEQSLTDDYRRRRLAMEQAPKVKEWMDLAHRRRDRLAEMVIEGFIRENRRRTVSGRSISLSVRPHEYWTMFRDLETIHAPPNLQASYVRPLIDLGEFDSGDELRYRLQLGVNETEKTEHWLARITDAHDVTLDDARKRDDALLLELTRSDTRKRERSRRLDVFPAIADILRLQDLEWARSFFLQCREDLKNGDNAWQNYSDDYISALCSYVDLETDPTVALDLLEDFMASDHSGRERYELARSLRHAIPSEQWVGLHEGAAERLIRLALGLVRSGEEHDALSADENLAWGLFSMFRGVRRFGRSLAADLTDEARQWALGLLQKKPPAERSHRQTVYSAATHLAHILAPDDAGRDEVVRMALATAEVETGEPHEGFTLGGPMSAWISLIESGANPSSSLMAEVAATLWTKLDGTWEETLRSVGPNLHAAWPYVAFLAQWLASGKPSSLPLVRERLLQILRATPMHLSLCAEVLAEEHWGNLWQPFVDLIWKYSSGGDSADPVAARLGVVDLLQRWVVPRTPESAKLSDDLSFLVDITLLAVRDESPAVANHAAYSVAGYAALARSPADVRRVAGGLRRMATDPRLGVRGAAAYAGKKLPVMDVAGEIREVALKIDEDLSTDPYAVIHRQRVFGELDGKHPAG